MANDELRRVTEILLQPEDDFQKLTGAIEDLFRLFQEAAGFEVGEEINRIDLHLPVGKAIAPFGAAMCLKDILRTKRFLRGLFLGIHAALKKFPSRPIHVVYAGTGPFATLVIPLTTVFTPNDVKFTLLEVNPVSIKYLKRVLATFEADQFIQKIIECDAATYPINPSDPIHLIVAETMQNALQKEPQVAIALNLVPHLVEGGLMIPRNIKVEAVLLDPLKNRERMVNCYGFEPDYVRTLGTIFELNIDTPKKYRFFNTVFNDSYVFPLAEIEISREIPAGYRQLSLFTTIWTYGDEILNPWQCSLTMPQNIRMLNRTEKPGNKFVCRYRMGHSPGFVIEFH